MPVFELRESSSSPSADSLNGSLIDQWRNELDSMFATLRKFEVMDVAEILLTLSAFSARAAEMRSQLVRVESRRTTAFRTREIDPFLEEVDRQFRIHSRLQAVREMEFRLSGGQV